MQITNDTTAKWGISMDQHTDKRKTSGMNNNNNKTNIVKKKNSISLKSVAYIQIQLFI